MLGPKEFNLFPEQLGTADKVPLEWQPRHMSPGLKAFYFMSIIEIAFSVKSICYSLSKVRYSWKTQETIQERDDAL